MGKALWHCYDHCARKLGLLVPVGLFLLETKAVVHHLACHGTGGKMRKWTSVTADPCGALSRPNPVALLCISPYPYWAGLWVRGPSFSLPNPIWHPSCHAISKRKPLRPKDWYCWVGAWWRAWAVSLPHHSAKSVSKKSKKWPMTL